MQGIQDLPEPPRPLLPSSPSQGGLRLVLGEESRALALSWRARPPCAEGPGGSSGRETGRFLPLPRGTVSITRTEQAVSGPRPHPGQHPADTAQVPLSGSDARRELCAEPAGSPAGSADPTASCQDHSSSAQGAGRGRAQSSEVCVRQQQQQAC